MQERIMTNAQMKDSRSSKRIFWIDALKGFAIISVVIGHALLGVEQANTYPEHHKIIIFFREWIYSWHMPLFMFLSGITFQMSCVKMFKPDWNKIRRNTLNLGVLYIIFASALPVLKLLFSKYVNNKVDTGSVIGSILLPETLMWYLWVMIIYYLSFPFLIKNRNFSKVYFVVFLLISTISYYCYSINIIKSLCIKNVFYCSVYFYCGVYFSELQKHITRKNLTIFASCAGIFLVYKIIAAFYLSIDKIIFVISDQVNAFALIILCIGYFKKYKDSNSKMCYLGRNSLIIYLLHTYFVTAMRVISNKVLGESFWIVSLILCSVIPLLICVLISMMSEKIIILKYLFRPIMLFDKKKSKEPN